MTAGSAKQEGPKRAAPRAVGLTPEAVIAAALEEIDSHGLHGFSMRSLARRLGVNATVIVWHLGNRNAVLAEVVKTVQRDLVPPRPPGQSWQERLRQIFTRSRDAVRQHPNVAPLIGAEIVSNARPDLGLVEALLEVLCEAGFEGVALRDAYNATHAALVGFTTQELAQMPSEDLAGWRTEMQDHLARADAEAHPILAREMPRLANRAFILRWQNGVEVPMHDAFTMYVDCFVAGLAACAPHTEPLRSTQKPPAAKRGTERRAARET